MKWQQASSLFLGSTNEALALKGRKVKNRVPLLDWPLYDPSSTRSETRDILANSIGLLANPINDEFLIAYPKTPGVPPTTLDKMMRSNDFFVIRVNWPTFRGQFDIEG